MEAAKAQNWGVEPQGKIVCKYAMFKLKPVTGPSDYSHAEVRYVFITGIVILNEIRSEMPSLWENILFGILRRVVC
jgi:hypothetical protein